MLVKLLGILDILIGIILFLVFLSVRSDIVLMFCAFYLLVKFIGFSMGSIAFGNFFDLFGAAIIFLSFGFQIPKFIFLIAAILILQKGLFSLK
jgi:hypothetical protein